jgi:hypothetical protein
VPSSRPVSKRHVSILDITSADDASRLSTTKTTGRETGLLYVTLIPSVMTRRMAMFTRSVEASSTSMRTSMRFGSIGSKNCLRIPRTLRHSSSVKIAHVLPPCAIGNVGSTDLSEKYTSGKATCFIERSPYAYPPFSYVISPSPQAL